MTRPLTQVATDLRAQLRATQQTLLDLRGQRRVNTHDARLSAALADLRNAAQQCDDEVYRRIGRWVTDPTYHARAQSLITFRDDHPLWTAELDSLDGFFTASSMASMVRTAKKHLEKSSGGRRKYSGALSSAKPVSAIVDLVAITYEQYCAGRRTSPQNVRNVRYWIDYQQRMLRVAAILISGCLEFDQNDERSRKSAYKYFNVSYALAVGASETEWKLV